MAAKGKGKRKRRRDGRHRSTPNPTAPPSRSTPELVPTSTPVQPRAAETRVSPTVGPDAFAAVDVQAAARGAWRGFLVLIFGELVAPLAARIAPALGSLWLSMVGAAGFAIAGAAIGQAQRPMAQGAATALGAFALTMPLRLLAGSRMTVIAYAVTCVFAVAVGAASGLLAARRRDTS